MVKRPKLIVETAPWSWITGSSIDVVLLLLDIYWSNIGIMEKKMEATIVYLCYLGNMALGAVLN